MKLDIISFHDLNNTKNTKSIINLKTALLQKGIVGIRDVPEFENKSRGLIPAYYFRNGIEIEEPDEAGLYITPSNGDQFEKINSSEKDILLFQEGEFGQLISDDGIKATKHMVRKAKDEIERYKFHQSPDGKH